MRPSRKEIHTNPLYKRAYKAWIKMRSRCIHPRNNRYKNYGGRGITFCDRWKSFDSFLEDMGLPPTPKHSIGRINNDGNYEHINCRWETEYEQNKNKRTNRFITIGNRTETLAEWGRISGVGLKLIWSRLNDGWSGNKLLIPVKKHKTTTSIQLDPAEYNGAKTLAQLSNLTGIRYHTLYDRYMKGWRMEKLSNPQLLR